MRCGCPLWSRHRARFLSFPPLDAPAKPAHSDGAMALSPELRGRLDELVKNNKILLFMKGNKQFPQCGFSARVVQLLNQTGAKYETINVLADPELREGIKEYSDWPTIPQLYINGEFQGGCDIVMEMSASGELAQKVGAAS